MELRFKESGKDVVSVTTVVTAQLPKGERDRPAEVLIEILNGAAILVSSSLIIDAETGEIAGSQHFALPATALAKSNNLLLRLTITTRYD